ncbi:hypothetical protein Pmani_000182 [Petrolisthes manimaculis]|uniref:Variant Ionotropic Glutamate Receptor n=1 Tax=Petrolisthes manimaculis TaxID=1843537 RepID=A0AAE1QM38_9EUCA|nr:hypothetical protein Pmani_000182 [Petrolisthes manimaculis]
MAPAKRQLTQFLPSLVLIYTTLFTTAVPQFLLIPDDDVLEQSVITTLLSGPLSGQDLLLVTDDYTQRLLDLDQVMEAAGASLTPVFLATQHSLLHTPRPAHHTKGTLLTALLLFHQDPTDFLLLLADNTNWNPSYLVLFCLNPNLNTTTVLSQPVVQRSHFILLLHPSVQAGRQRIYAYTSLPMQVSGRGRPLTKAPMGLWTQHNFHTRQSLFQPRFQNFGGYEVKVTSLCYDEPFLYFGGKYGCQGVNVDALHILSDKLGFKLSLSFPDTIAWGYKVNGTWKGLLGILKYEEKDLNINVLQPNPDRNSDFDYIYPYWETNFSFMLVRPPPLPQWRNILYPFSTLMWGLVFTLVLVVPSLLAYLLHRINGITDPIGIAIKIASGIVNQSVSIPSEVQDTWARVWLMFWWLSVYILSSVFTGNLVAVLTVPAFPTLINTVNELADTNLIPSMGDYGSFVPNALRTSQNPTLATLGERLFLDSDLKRSDPYGFLISKVIEGTHALLVVGDYLRYTQNKKKITRTTYLMDETKLHDVVPAQTHALHGYFLPPHDTPAGDWDPGQTVPGSRGNSHHSRYPGRLYPAAAGSGCFLSCPSVRETHQNSTLYFHYRRQSVVGH